MPSREPELYKDKIEASLDGRQIFYLFFGGAVIVGLVFVLGVLVGRRVEARGHLDRAETQAESDPLAALDRLERSDRLSFRGALRGSEAPTEVEKAIGELEKRRAAVKTEKAEKAEPDKSEEPVTRPSAVDKPKAEKRSEGAGSSEKKARKHDDAAGERAESKSESKPEKSESKPESKAERAEGKHADKGETKPETKAETRAETRAEKERFTLQLSSFQDKSEA